jgi:hypothetical protein
MYVVQQVACEARIARGQGQTSRSRPLRSWPSRSAGDRVVVVEVGNEVTTVMAVVAEVAGLPIGATDRGGTQRVLLRMHPCPSASHGTQTHGWAGPNMARTARSRLACLLITGKIRSKNKAGNRYLSTSRGTMLGGAERDGGNH